MAEIFRLSRTWFAKVDGKTMPLTRQNLMSPVNFSGPRPGIVRVLDNGQAELMELKLGPEDFSRQLREAA